MEVKERTIVFDTFITIEDENYFNDNYFDGHIMLFEVPKDWAEKWMTDWAKTETDIIDVEDAVKYFSEEYTWHDTMDMYEEALWNGVITSEKVVERVW